MPSLYQQHAKTSHDLLKISFTVKVWFVKQRHGWKPHYHLPSLIPLFLGIFFTPFGTHFRIWRLRNNISRKLVYSLWSPFLFKRMIIPVYLFLVDFQVFTPPDKGLSNKVLFLRSMPSTFQVGFPLHQQPFRILVLIWLLPLLSMRVPPLPQSQKKMCQCMSPLMGWTNL